MHELKNSYRSQSTVKIPSRLAELMKLRCERVVNDQDNSQRMGKVARCSMRDQEENKNQFYARLHSNAEQYNYIW